MSDADHASMADTLLQLAPPAPAPVWKAEAPNESSVSDAYSMFRAHTRVLRLTCFNLKLTMRACAF